jgi:uncharacterized protein (TIGR02246 family)
MKLTIILTALVAVFLTACQSVPIDISPEDHSEIELSSKKWVETYNQNDWEGLAAFFTPDAIMMPPNGLAVQGREAIATWERANETGFRIAFKLEAIEGRGDLAYVRGRSCVFIPDGTGGYGVDVGKFLEVRKQQSNGEWLIEADIFNSNLGAGADLLGTCPFANLPEVQ